MKKLEFLAASLPYGLKAQFKEKEIKYYREKVVGTISGIYDDCSIVCHDTVNACPIKFKPIIRPLSDLTKLCVQKDYNDGNPFKPIAEIQRRNDFIYTHNDQFVIGVQQVYYMDELPTWVIIMLLKWHFWPDMPESEEVVCVTEEFNPYK
jgi:hypothetical protein